MMKNNRTNIHAIRVILALILCITLMPLGAFAEEVPGAADQQSGAQTTQTETPETPVQPVTPPIHTETLFVWGDVNLQFSTAPVLVDKPLGLDAEPTNLKVKKVRKGRKVTWKKASGVVDGYIILRKTGKSDFFVEVGITEPGKKSFTDKSAKKKKSYSYTVVGFRNEPEGITISPCADTGVNKGTRAYQNPRKYVQISNTISKHGHDYYTAPVLVNDKSTKKDHIEAMIKTAYKYLGDPYVVCRSGAPGKGLDCSLQATRHPYSSAHPDPALLRCPALFLSPRFPLSASELPEPFLALAPQADLRKFLPQPDQSHPDPRPCLPRGVLYGNFRYSLPPRKRLALIPTPPKRFQQIHRKTKNPFHPARHCSHCSGLPPLLVSVRDADPANRKGIHNPGSGQGEPASMS